jgi:hypothetical protein
MRSMIKLPVTKQVHTRGKVLDLFCEKFPSNVDRDTNYSARDISWVSSVHAGKSRYSVLT